MKHEVEHLFFADAAVTSGRPLETLSIISNELSPKEKISTQVPMNLIPGSGKWYFTIIQFDLSLLPTKLQCQLESNNSISTLNIHANVNCVYFLGSRGSSMKALSDVKIQDKASPRNQMISQSPQIRDAKILVILDGPNRPTQCTYTLTYRIHNDTRENTMTLFALPGESTIHICFLSAPTLSIITATFTCYLPPQLGLNCQHEKEECCLREIDMPFDSTERRIILCRWNENGVYSVDYKPVSLTSLYCLLGDHKSTTTYSIRSRKPTKDLSDGSVFTHALCKQSSAKPAIMPEQENDFSEFFTSQMDKITKLLNVAAQNSNRLRERDQQVHFNLEDTVSISPSSSYDAESVKKQTIGKDSLANLSTILPPCLASKCVYACENGNNIKDKHNFHSVSASHIEANRSIRKFSLQGVRAKRNPHTSIKVLGDTKSEPKPDNISGFPSCNSSKNQVLHAMSDHSVSNFLHKADDAVHASGECGISESKANELVSPITSTKKLRRNKWKKMFTGISHRFFPKKTNP